MSPARVRLLLWLWAVLSLAGSVLVESLDTPIAARVGLLAAVLLPALWAVDAVVRRSNRPSQADITAAGLTQEVTRLTAALDEGAHIMSAMKDGVVILDDVGRIVRANAAAARLFSLPVESMQGERMVTIARNFPATELAQRAWADQAPIIHEVRLPGPRYFSVQVIPLRTQEQGKRLALLFIDDETETLRTDAVRRDFVANVSHELKTPLASLSLLASTLEYAVDEDPMAAKGFAARVSGEIKWLNGLVDDLLTLSKFEPQGAAQAREQVDLAAVTRGAAAEVLDKSSQERVVSVDAPHPVAVLADRAGLEAVVRNLLSNALRFTDDGGHVWVTVRIQDDEAVLTVRDDGIGIPKDEQSRVFERFYRVDKARSRETGGTGLGLSIVRHVVEEHRGSVEIESTLGLGSTFTVRLPLVGDATLR